MEKLIAPTSWKIKDEREDNFSSREVDTVCAPNPSVQKWGRWREKETQERGVGVEGMESWTVEHIRFNHVPLLGCLQTLLATYKGLLGLGSLEPPGGQPMGLFFPVVRFDTGCRQPFSTKVLHALASLEKKGRKGLVFFLSKWIDRYISRLIFHFLTGA